MMEDIPTYKEEYWEDALKTLKREERKAAWKKRLPFFFLIFIGGLFSFILAYNSILPQAKSGYQLADNSIESVKLAASTEANKIEAFSARESASISDNDFDEQTLIAQKENSDEQVEDNLQFQEAKGTAVNAAAFDEKEAEKVQGARSNQNEITATEEFAKVKTPIEDPKSAADLPELELPEKTEDAFLSNRTVMHKMALRAPENRLNKGLALDYNRQIVDVNLLRDRQNHIYLAVGNAFFTGYGRAGEGLRLNPEIALGYYRLLTDKIALSASVNYMEINGIGHVHEVSATSYGFGAEIEGTRFRTDKLMYLHLPVAIHYNLNRRHSLHADLGAQYLLNVRSSVVDFNDENLSVKRTETGYSQGYKNTIVQAGIGYQYRLSSNLSLGCSYFAGVSDVRAADYYTNSSNNKNSRLMINLNYQLKP